MYRLSPSLHMRQVCLCALDTLMRTFRKRKIAFIFYPYAPHSARLDTMPFAAHILERLITAGWDIDIFLWDRSGFSQNEAKPPEGVQLKYANTPMHWARPHAAQLTFRFARCIGYSCVFSVGQKGSYVGGIVSAVSRCPHILLNDEFPSPWEAPIWAYLDRWSANRAELIIVPSDERENKLRELLGLVNSTPFVTVRNTAKVNERLPAIDWHDRLGIPPGRKIFINAGFLHDWSQVPEIMTSVSCWAEDVVLLLHSSNREESLRYRERLSHLENPGRVFWSHEPLTEDMLHSLIMHCHGSFGLYRNDGPNTELAGTSSGKIMRSIACGTPVIASAFKSFEFVTREGVGVQVNHPAEISSAIIELVKNKKAYRDRCYAFAKREKSLRDEAWAKIVECIKTTSRAQLDLSCASDANGAPRGRPTLVERRKASI
jgi:hypothetical protein